MLGLRNGGLKSSHIVNRPCSAPLSATGAAEDSGSMTFDYCCSATESSPYLEVGVCHNVIIPVALNEIRVGRLV